MTHTHTHTCMFNLHTLSHIHMRIRSLPLSYAHTYECLITAGPMHPRTYASGLAPWHTHTHTHTHTYFTPLSPTHRLASEDDWWGRYRIMITARGDDTVSYSEALARSKFCLVAPGDGWSARAEDSITHGTWRTYRHTEREGYANTHTHTHRKSGIHTHTQKEWATHTHTHTHTEREGYTNREIERRKSHTGNEGEREGLSLHMTCVGHTRTGQSRDELHTVRCTHTYTHTHRKRGMHTQGWLCVCLSNA